MPWREVSDEDAAENRDLFLDFKNAHKLSRFEGIITCCDVQEPYMPSRVTRQFGRRQTVPPLPIDPTTSNRTISSVSYKILFEGLDFPRWTNRDNHLINIDAMKRCKWAWDCDPFYLTYHLDISHPYVDPTSPQESDRQNGHVLPIPRVSDATAVQILCYKIFHFNSFYMLK